MLKSPAMGGTHFNQPLLWLVALGVMLTGCAVQSIGSKGERLDGVKIESDFGTDVTNALLLADGYRRGYLRRADIQGSAREIGGLVTIAGATTALYYGLNAKDKYRDRVIRIASLSAGALAAGQWALPPSEELIYIEGARAMTCAALVAIPQLLPKSVVDEKLPGELSRLDDTLRNTRNRIETVLPADRVMALAAIEEGEAVYAAAQQLAARAEIQARLLRERVLLIDTEVRNLLTSNAPNFQALNALVVGLAGSAKNFGSGLLAPKPTTTAPATSSSGKLPNAGNRAFEAVSSSSALEQLETARRALIDAIRPIAARIAIAGSRQADLSGISGCIPKAAVRFSIAPDAASMDISKTLTIVVTDKGGFPSANIVGDNADAVELDPIQLGSRDNEYRLVVTAKKVPGDSKSPTLAIRSTNGLEGRDIKLMIKAATGAAPGTAKPTTDQVPLATPSAGNKLWYSAPQTEFEAALLGSGDSPEVILALQCYLKDSYPPGSFVPDCQLGANTRQAIANLRGQPLITKELRDAAVAALPDGPTARCALAVADRCTP